VTRSDEAHRVTLPTLLDHATATGASGFAAPASDGSLSLRCEGCGAAITVAAGLRTTKCPYCASPAVVDRPPDPNRAEPTFVVGFVVTHERALAAAKDWVKRPWFAPRAFRHADIADVRGIYLPAYLYTAEAHAEYEAEIGENYTVVETYTTTENGKTVTRTRTRTETEWRHLTGSWSAYVDEVLVTASRGLSDTELDHVEPFDLRALRRFTPKLLAGWIAEDPSIDAGTCAARAREQANETVGARLGRHMPGDSHRGLGYRTTLRNEDQELLMLPIWVLAIRYAKDKPLVRLVINGQTGALWGKSPLSWAKIVGAILIGLALVVGIALVVGMK
jgi:DNA-directed RNA polymerase subunit RPC12/RpoP